MALSFQQTETVADCDGALYCSGATDVAGGSIRKALVGGTAGGTFDAQCNAVGSSSSSAKVMWELTVDSGVSWDAGTWTVRWVQESANMNMTLNEVHICRVNSSCVSQATIGSLTGIGLSLNTTGLHTFNVSGSAQTPGAGDKVVIIFVTSNGSMSNQNAPGTSDQIIDSPFTESAGVNVTPATASLSLSTFAPTVTAPQSATPTTASLTLTSFAPTIGIAATVTPTTASLNLSTFAPAVTATANRTVTPPAASLSLTEFAPTVSAPRVVTPATASLSLSTFAPTVSTPQTVTPTTASLSLSTFAPTVSTPVAVTPTTASLSLTAFAPTVDANANIEVTPSTASLSLTTFVPTVSATANVSVTPTTASLSLSTFAPAIQAGGNVEVTPDTLALSITAFAPTVLTPVVVTVGKREAVVAENDDGHVNSSFEWDNSALVSDASNTGGVRFASVAWDGQRTWLMLNVTAHDEAGAGTITIRAARAADAGEFSTLNSPGNGGDWGSTTSASTTITPSGTGWVAAEVTGMLQELVDNVSWVTGNAVAFELVYGNGSSSPAFTFADYPDANAAQLAQLTSFALTGFAPTAGLTGNRVVTPATASLSLTTFAPTVSAGDAQEVTPGAASLATTAFAPTVSTPVAVTPATASLSITVFAPAIDTPVSVTPSTASLTLTTFAADVAGNADVEVTPATASLTLAIFAPTAATPVTATPGVAALTITAFAPDVSSPFIATPETASLTITAFAPTIVNPVSVTIGLLALAIVTFAPTTTVQELTVEGGGLPAPSVTSRTVIPAPRAAGVTALSTPRATAPTPNRAPSVAADGPLPTPGGQTEPRLPAPGAKIVL